MSLESRVYFVSVLKKDHDSRIPIKDYTGRTKLFRTSGEASEAAWCNFEACITEHREQIIHYVVSTLSLALPRGIVETEAEDVLLIIPLPANGSGSVQRTA